MSPYLIALLGVAFHNRLCQKIEKTASRAVKRPAETAKRDSGRQNMAAVCSSYGPWLTTTFSVQVPEFAGFSRLAPGMSYCGGMIVFASPGRLSKVP